MKTKAIWEEKWRVGEVEKLGWEIKFQSGEHDHRGRWEKVYTTCCSLSHDESWVRWTNSHGLSWVSANYPVLLFPDVLTIRVNERLRRGWWYNWNRPTLRVSQLGDNSVFTRKQVGNSTLHKRPFAILQRAPHDLLSLGFSPELFKELHTHVVICKLKRTGTLLSSLLHIA